MYKICKFNLNFQYTLAHYTSIFFSPVSLLPSFPATVSTSAFQIFVFTGNSILVKMYSPTLGTLISFSTLPTLFFNFSASETLCIFTWKVRGKEKLRIRRKEQRGRKKVCYIAWFYYLHISYGVMWKIYVGPLYLLHKVGALVKRGLCFYNDFVLWTIFYTYLLTNQLWTYHVQ